MSRERLLIIRHQASESTDVYACACVSHIKPVAFWGEIHVITITSIAGSERQNKLLKVKQQVTEFKLVILFLKKKKKSHIPLRQIRPSYQDYNYNFDIFKILYCYH